VIFALGLSVLKLNFFVKAICRGEAGRMRVALSFDDGPDPASTPRLLDVLERCGIRAAFFVVGVKTAAHPEVVRQMEQQGHIVGNHSYGHAWWTNFLTGRRLDREIGKSQDAIEAATGKIPAYFRPPMGLTNPHLPGALNRAGLSVVGWDVRPFDTGVDTGKVIHRVMKKVRDGSIILLHDAGRHPDDLARLVEGLAEALSGRGYLFTGLEELTGAAAYQTGIPAGAKGPSGIRWAWQESVRDGKAPRIFRFLALLVAGTAYVRKAIEEQTDLGPFRRRPSARFLTGMGLVLFSYVLGWPMVGLFSLVAAYSGEPLFLLGGPVCYGFSHLVWMLGMFLAGRDSIRYADIFIRWGLRRGVERVLNEIPPHPADKGGPTRKKA
jgi:peptidoglycan/xylan/chitin deacetylase (PgdA/CDA1 family)